MRSENGELKVRIVVLEQKISEEKRELIDEKSIFEKKILDEKSEGYGSRES